MIRPYTLIIGSYTMMKTYTLVIIRYYTQIIVTYSDNDTDVHTDNGNGKRIIERITMLKLLCA